MTLVDIKAVTSPTLSSGVVAVASLPAFGKFEKVDYAIADLDSDTSSIMDASRNFQIVKSISGNTVTVTIYMYDPSVNAGCRQVATTAAVAGKTLTVLAAKI